jgi:hypothetical protein
MHYLQKCVHLCTSQNRRSYRYSIANSHSAYGWAKQAIDRCNGGVAGALVLDRLAA